MRMKTKVVIMLVVGIALIVLGYLGMHNFAGWHKDIEGIGGLLLLFLGFFLGYVALAELSFDSHG